MIHALYRFFDPAGDLLYVGITFNPGNRWAAHRDDKPWWQQVANIRIETHPDRASVLLAESAAIRAERPRYNHMHNRSRPQTPPSLPTPSEEGRWIVESKRSGYRRQCDLYLYPELDCSSVVDDFWDLDGLGQFEAYVDYISRHYPPWLADDAVPIYWSVESNPRGIYEAAPQQLLGARDFLKYFAWPEDANTGELLDWYSLPVVNKRFPEFAKALAWTPSPLQPTCPLASILRSRRGLHPVNAERRPRSGEGAGAAGEAAS